MSITAKFKNLTRPEQLSIVFYIVSGAFLLALLPFSGFAPHLGLIGVFSIITGVIVLMKRGWAVWFVMVQVITALVFAFWTMVSVGSSNWLIVAGLAVYAVLDLAATLYLTVLRKTGSL